MLVRSLRTAPVRSARRPGFTLMEVMIAAAILVVLAGVSGVLIFGYLDDAKVNAAKAGVMTLEKACQNYKIKNGDWPESLEVLGQPQGSRPAEVDPKALFDPWGRPYGYEPGNVNPNTFFPRIYSQGPNPGDPNGMIYNW